MITIIIILLIIIVIFAIAIIGISRFAYVAVIDYRNSESSYYQINHNYQQAMKRSEENASMYEGIIRGLRADMEGAERQIAVLESRSSTIQPAHTHNAAVPMSTEHL